MTVFHRPAIGAGGDASRPEVGAEVSWEFLDRIPGGVFRYRADDGGAFDYVNRGLLEMLGCATYEQFVELTANSFWGMVHPDDRERVRQACDPETVQDDRVRYRVVRRDGRVRWVDDHGRRVVDSAGTPWYYVTLLDVTEAVRLQEELDAANERLEALAMLDSYQQRAEEDGLTRIPNRVGVQRRVRELLECADGRPCSFFIIDVDDFKAINDTFGHPVGDDVLKALARHLRNTVRHDDVVGRIGGDEFVVFCMGLGAGAAQRALAERLQAWHFPHGRADDGDLLLDGPTLSMGVASSEDSTLTLDELYALADAALYRAKEQGKNRVGFSAAV
ncbi:sensor domain-containing diguanylate cyclase [Caniella muris]|uniref:sensor domain-containing diguanylate cyclase n=1 Tax=Caniella muris TaxID=2941502 RepID=UPI00203BACB4|nr:sensor domain-containing diguanylate cyclase [Caniella muris]